MNLKMKHYYFIYWKNIQDKETEYAKLFTELNNKTFIDYEEEYNRKSNCKDFKLTNAVVINHLVFKSIFEINDKLEKENKEFRIGLSPKDLDDYFDFIVRENFKERGCLDKSGYPIYEKMFDEIIRIRKMIKDYAHHENLIGIEELISTLGKYSLPIIAIKLYFYKAFEKAFKNSAE